MSQFKIFFSFFLALTLLSCGKAKKSELEIEMIGESSYLINATAQSCANKAAVALSPSTAEPTSDITAHYFSIEGATITWKNTSDTAHIVQMKIDFGDDKNIPTPCTIAGDELLGVFFDYGTKTSWDGTISAAVDVNTPATLTSQCKLRCGGISVPDNTKPFVAVGTLTLSGFQRSQDGTEKPIKARATVKVLYE